MNYILAYYNLIKLKKVVVSKKVKLQYDKLVYDIENPGKYHFDLEKATRPIEFIEKFCKHSKGQWAGKPVVLDIWQKAFLQAVFGFVDEKGFRRYREALLIVARKNGKSTLLSCIALYMLIADHEGGAQVCCVASKKDQAKLVFNEAKNMVQQSPYLKKYIKPRKSDLYFAKTFSTFEPLSSDSNTLDGLNMHCGIIDELHALKDRNIYDVSIQSMSTRQQPLLCEISTAGFVRENIFDDRYDYGTNVLEGTINDERILSLFYELDDKKEWTDKTKWEKANPGLGTIKDINTLNDYVEQAKNNPKFLPTVLTKDFNIRETAVNSWLSFTDINNTETYDYEEHRNLYAIGGVDLSSVWDLTCATVIYRFKGKWYVRQMYFIPEDVAEEKERQDKVPYKVWKEQGFVRFCQGNKIKDSDVTDWFIELREKYNIFVWFTGFDPWTARMWVEQMKQNGFVMEEVRQGAKTMSNPMKQLACEIRAKNINYNNNPILKWCLTNTQTEIDKNDNIRPVKGRNSKQRIDGAVSLIDAYCVLMNHYDDYITMTDFESEVK